MKYPLFFLVLLTGTTTHSQCNAFDNLLKKGGNYLKGDKPNYQEAINAYTAAILACTERAGEAKQRITKMVSDINKLKEEAMAAENEAKEAKDEAVRALVNLEKANSSTVALLLKNANGDILKLQYEDALQKVKAAANLGTLKPEVAKIYLEIAFWQGEAGKTRRAKTLLDSVAMLVDKEIDSNKPFRKAIESLDPELYKNLMERYYPVLVPVVGGVFEMGCDPGVKCYNLHEQELSSFRMAKYETTWWQYYLFSVGTGHQYESAWGVDGDNPVVNVSWFDAILYLNWINNQFQLDTPYVIRNKHEELYGDSYDVTLSPIRKKGYRLPTEAEWEYAAKGGKHHDKSKFSGGNNLDSLGWYDRNSDNRTQAVGKKKANALGLYDMSGNVWEWCWDWYNEYNKSVIEKDYIGPISGAGRVARGGSWFSQEVICSSAYRSSGFDNQRNGGIGFRLVFIP